MATLEFTKMHGCGNDYIYIVAMRVRPADPSALSVKLSDRHFGIGADVHVIRDRDTFEDQIRGEHIVDLKPV